LRKYHINLNKYLRISVLLGMFSFLYNKVIQFSQCTPSSCQCDTVQSQFELYGGCRKGVGPSGAAIPFSAALRSFLHKFISVTLLTLSHISHTLFPPSFFSPVPQIDRQTNRRTDKKSGEGLLGRHRKLIQGDQAGTQ